MAPTSAYDPAAANPHRILGKPRPYIHVTLGGQVAPLPTGVVRLPLIAQPRDHRWRQVRSVTAQQGAERLLEIAHRDPAQVEDWQQGIQAPRPSSPARQNCR